MEDLNSEALIRTAKWELLAGEVRLRQCSECPASGGRCDTESRFYRPVMIRTKLGSAAEPSESEFPRGAVPVWTPEGLRSRRCERWTEYAFRQELDLLGVPPEFHSARFETYEPRDPSQAKALDLCREYVRIYAQDRERGAGIFLKGSTGVGKSHLSAAVLASLVQQNPEITARFVYVPEFLQAHRSALRGPGEEADYVAMLAEVEFLVFDDLGVEAITSSGGGKLEWVRERIETILAHRASHRLPTCITTNSSIQELEHRYHPRSLRRCFQMCSVRVEFQERDYL